METLGSLLGWAMVLFGLAPVLGWVPWRLCVRSVLAADWRPPSIWRAVKGEPRLRAVTVGRIRWIMDHGLPARRAPDLS